MNLNSPLVKNSVLLIDSKTAKDFSRVLSVQGNRTVSSALIHISTLQKIYIGSSFRVSCRYLSRINSKPVTKVTSLRTGLLKKLTLSGKTISSVASVIIFSSMSSVEDLIKSVQKLILGNHTRLASYPGELQEHEEIRVYLDKCPKELLLQFWLNSEEVLETVKHTNSSLAGTLSLVNQFELNHVIYKIRNVQEVLSVVLYEKFGIAKKAS